MYPHVIDSRQALAASYTERFKVKKGKGALPGLLVPSLPVLVCVIMLDFDCTEQVVSGYVEVPVD